MKRIYLDYASLTPIDKGVIKIINKYSGKDYTNPAAIYYSAVKAKNAIDDAKLRISKILHIHSDEIIFTSGGTESNQLILNSFIDKQILISSIEHSSIINNKKAIHVSVDKEGIIDLELLKKTINNETALISVMMVNNEIGSIQPIQEIVKIARDFSKKFNTKIYVHTDACQAIVHFPLYLEKLGVDFMTLDGHKMYGPRGIGMIYVKRGSIKIERPGTSNTPAILGFAHALEIVDKIKEKENIRIKNLKSNFFSELIKIDPNIKINGNLNNTSPHILNITIPNIDNEFFVLKLDAKGIECSTKSACLRDEDESYVLREIKANSKNSVRFSFGRNTTNADLKYSLKVIKEILARK